MEKNGNFQPFPFKFLVEKNHETVKKKKCRNQDDKK